MKADTTEQSNQKPGWKHVIVSLLLLSEEGEHAFSRRRGIGDPASGTQKSFGMTWKKYV